MVANRLMPIRAFIGTRVNVKIDRPIGSKHPQWEFRYPLNYGYVLGTMGEDGEPIDTYVLGVTTPPEEFSGVCIAVIHRFQDEDKLVVAPEGQNYSDEHIAELTDFQEKYFRSVIIRQSPSTTREM